MRYIIILSILLFGCGDESGGEQAPEQKAETQSQPEPVEEEQPIQEEPELIEEKKEAPPPVEEEPEQESMLEPWTIAEEITPWQDCEEGYKHPTYWEFEELAPKIDSETVLGDGYLITDTPQVYVKIDDVKYLVESPAVVEGYLICILDDGSGDE